mgnify:CR=1 FL=1|tara:strand:+ start:464 stop:901 length:438 start_codon:yes stop_codon:yes gene_type:complete
MNITVRHTGITTTDMDRALWLYRDIFGLKVKIDTIEEGDFVDNLVSINNVKVRVVKLKDKNGGMIELLQYQSHPESAEKNFIDGITNIGCSHVAFTVNDIDDIYSKLMDEGINFNYPPQLSPNGMAKVSFFRDFDGTLLELVEEI